MTHIDIWSSACHTHAFAGTRWENNLVLCMGGQETPSPTFGLKPTASKGEVGDGMSAIHKVSTLLHDRYDRALGRGEGAMGREGGPSAAK